MSSETTWTSDERITVERKIERVLGGSGAISSGHRPMRQCSRRCGSSLEEERGVFTWIDIIDPGDL